MNYSIILSDAGSIKDLITLNDNYGWGTPDLNGGRTWM